MRVRINLVITCLLLAVGHIHAQSIWDGTHLQKVIQTMRFRTVSNIIVN